jgi:hypothetical protein
MRNFKKLLVVICVMALLTASCVFAALAADDGNVADLNALITAAETATGATAKYNAILSAVEYNKTVPTYETGYADAQDRLHALCVDGADVLLDTVNVNNLTASVAYDNMMKADDLLELFTLAEETEGYADVKVKYDTMLVKALGVLVKACDANIETTLKTANNAIAVNKVNSLVHYCVPFGDATVLDSLLAEFAPLAEAQERAEQKNYLALDSENKISNYDLPIYFTETWEERDVGMDSSKLGGRWTVDLKNIANRMGIQKDRTGNKYMVHRYLEKVNPQSTYTQIGLSTYKVNNEDGLVFEFDVTTFDKVPNAGVIIETGSVGGAYFPPPYFVINGNGDICKNDKSTVALAGAIVKGEWTHIVLVLNPEDFVYSLYVDGQFICDYDAKYEGKTRYDHSKVAFRISGGTGTAGEIAVDNINIYGGDSYRIHDRLETMTDDEEFLYYVNYLVNDKNAVAERSIAYEYANKLIGNYWVEDEDGNGTYTEYALANPDLLDAVDTYVAFDLDAFLYEVGIRNLDSYIALVEAAAAVKRDMSTALQRQQLVDEINKFVNKNVDIINREIDRDGTNKADYYEYEAIASRISREAKYDAGAEAFIRYIQRFDKATTLSAKQRNYDHAYEIAENDGIDISLILDETNPDRANFANLIAAYEIYRNADKDLYELTLSNNSNKIIKCINRINMYTTEEEWLANRELMEEYLFLLKDIVLTTDEAGNLKYDAEYKGIDEALDFFHASYSYFYAIIQTEHVEHISDVLERVAANDAYIEKMGMISGLEKYIETNDIDYQDERIINLLNNLETCKAELVLREADYAKLLVQNSVYFNNLVERMRTAQTYNEQKEYYEQAYLLYFNVDISVEGTAKAVEIFDEFKINLDRIAKSSVAFIEAVAIYKACETEEDKYAALVECYYNAQFVELSYDGAEEAMAEYLAAYNAYMNYVDSVNNDVTATGNAIGSLRVPCGITNVIAIILKKLFGV